MGKKRIVIYEKNIYLKNIFLFTVQSEEIDYNKTKNAILYSKDQNGCRMLQRWLDQKNQKAFRDIFDSVNC